MRSDLWKIRMPRWFLQALFYLALLLSSGCTALGPDYTQPEVEVASNWLESGDPRISSRPLVDPEWWKSTFQDPDLAQLVDTAFEQNLDLRSAGLRVLQSQQQLAIAVGSQYPQQQQATGTISRERENAVTFNNYSLGFNLSWEIDFWGRFKRQVESAEAALDASVANYDSVLVSLVAQVAQNYILIRTYEDRLKVARENVWLQEESLRISTAKYNAGEVSELDVYQARSLLNNTMATLGTLEISLQQFKNSLTVLLGKPPGDISILLDKKRGVPAVQAVIALGMPQDTIRRRPDIRSAERQLAAQSGQIGFAVTELYPHFTIGGSIGASAENSGDMFTRQGETWSVFGGFNWSILNYGRLRSNVRLQDALFQQLLVDYTNTVLQAQGEVENAIVAYLRSHEQLASYVLAASASQRAVEIANIQYQQGQTDFNTLITTLKSNEQQQDLLASARGSVATNLIQVYKALGGGWEIRANRDPVDLLPSDMKEEMRQRTSTWKGVLK